MCACGETTPSPAAPTGTLPPPAPSSSNPHIVACGTYVGAGPFVVDADLAKASATCLTFSGNVGAKLDCGGHEVWRVTLSNVQDFTMTNCAMRAGVVQTLRVIDSRNVTVDNVEVSGSVFVQASHDSTLRNSRFLYPVLPANPNGFVSAELYLIGGQNNRVIGNTIDGGWDGNPATYQTQGCDDGILINNETNAWIEGNTIRNAFDAGIESSASPGPITTTILNNEIVHMGYTGIGGYYIPGWRDSTFKGNVVSQSPSLVHFDGVSARAAGVTSLTLIGNRFENNSLRDPVKNQAKYGGGFSPAVVINYVVSGLPSDVVGNAFRNNDFGTASPGPALAPASGFIDEGGNICQPGGFLTCG